MSDKLIGRIRFGVVLGVLVLSGLVFLMLPVSALKWSRIPFPGFLLDPNLVVSDTGNLDWERQKQTPPIAYPEQIVAVDGVAVNTIRAFHQILLEHRVGDQIAITLRQPINSRVPPRYEITERTVTVSLTQFSQRDLWNQFWLFYLTGLLMLGIGGWAFRARPKEEEAQVFAVLSAFGALTIGAVFDQVTAQQFIRVWIFALSMVGALGTWLSFVFPHESRLIHRFPWLRWLIPIPAVAAAVWGELWLNWGTDPWAYAIPWRAAYILNGFGLATVIFVMAYRRLRTQSALVKQQARLILGGSIIAFLPLLLFFITAGLGFQHAWLPPTFYIPPVAIFPFIIGYIIVRYRLMDTGGKFVRRSVAYSVMTMLLAGILVLVVTGLTATFGSVVENPWFVAVFLVIMAAAFDPVRSRFQRGIDQAFFSETQSFEKLLLGYRRELTTAVHMDQVADVLLKYIRLGIPDSMAKLYLPDHKTSCFTSYANHSDVVVNTSSPLVAFMRQQDGAIDLAEERAWPDTLLQYKETVQSLAAKAIVPMSNGKDLLGWVTLAPKSTSAKIESNQLNYLSSLAEQTLLGMERANVVRRLENRVAELDLLTHFSQFLSFTVEFDDLLELVFTNFERLIEIEDFFVVLRDKELDYVYKAFHVEKCERLSVAEGRHQIETNAHVLKVVETGQSKAWQGEENGRFHFAAPLNSGRETLGAIYTFYRDPIRSLRPRQQQLFGVFADRTAVALERLQSGQSLTKRAQQMEIMNQVTPMLASTLELEPLLELILDKGMELLDTEAGTFMLTIPDTGELEFRVVRGPASDELLGNRLPIGKGLAGTAAQTGRPVIVNNVQNDPRWFSDVDAKSEYTTQTILTIPLIRLNQVLGVLQVINKRDRSPFREEDQSLLMAFAGQAVVAIENARLITQTDIALRKSVDELSLLQQLDLDLNNTLLDVGRVLNLTLTRMLGICKGTAGAIVLLDDEKRPYFFETSNYDEDFEVRVAQDPGLLMSGLVGKVIRTGKPHITGNVHQEDEYVVSNFSTLSQMTLPFVSKQQVIGVIAVERDKLVAFDPHDVETAVRVANHAAVAIDNAILIEKVNEANQAKSEFVSMVSHELKTPMTAIRGYVDLLLSGMTGELNEQQLNFMETIAANIRRMGQQIQDLTDISRIETK
ncbi:MAG: GAF domain-containing protein, partial [Chloroflexi bacterium]